MSNRVLKAAGVLQGKLDAERRRILKVLRPFAKAARVRKSDGEPASEQIFANISGVPERNYTVCCGHLYAAARLYRELGGRV